MARGATALGFLPLLPLLPLLLLQQLSAAGGVESAAALESYQYTTKHITVPVDHFSFSKADTFKLRYLVNDTWWDKRKPGPILFYTGNEGDITLFAQNTGFVWDIASEFRALVVFAEHRYYGESLPYGEKSYSEPQYLGYLTAQQALADFVAVIRAVRADAGQVYPRLSPVIAFGGSYGGMLSAWIRMKYPHMVAGAISASAPILMSAGLTPCDAFSRITTSVYHAVDPNCSDNIRRSWAAFRNLTKTDGGKEWVSKEFSLRKPLKTEQDVQALLGWLNDAYVDVAMANYPYPANFLGDMPAYPVAAVCKPLRSRVTDEKQLAKSILSGISVYFNYTGNSKQLDVNNTGSQLGTSGWDFQACSEMAMPMCSDGVADMFERSPWDYKEYSDTCFQRWKVRPVYNMTGWEFGGKDLKGFSNIVFSNGLLDPWSCGGVVSNMSRSVQAVIIPEGAHHIDLRAQNPADPASVRGARRLHRQAMRRWIKEHWAAAAAAEAVGVGPDGDGRDNRLPVDTQPAGGDSSADSEEATTART